MTTMYLVGDRTDDATASLRELALAFSRVDKDPITCSSCWTVVAEYKVFRGDPVCGPCIGDDRIEGVAP